MELQVTPRLYNWQLDILGTALTIADGPCVRESAEAGRILNAAVTRINQAIANRIGPDLHPENRKMLSREIMRSTFIEAARMVNEDWVTV